MIPKWYDIALAELNQAEIPGVEDNPRIQEYLRTVFDYKQHDEMAWCSAFVNWCLLQAGEQATHSALARSWMNYGTALAKPAIGAICVFRRGSESWQGHVGFFAGFAAGNYQILGGNQDDKVSYDIFPASALLAVRWPGRSERRTAERYNFHIADGPAETAVELF